MVYMIAAYVVLWAISFGLVASILLRQRRIEAELDVVRDTVEEEQRARQTKDRQRTPALQA
jgi:hypothetical protein